MFLKTLIFLALIITGPSLCLGSTTTPDFLSRPSTSTHRNLLLTFTPSPTSIIRSISSQNFANRGEKIQELVTKLKNHAQTKQKAVQDFLSQKNIPFTPIWISNQLSIPNVDNALYSEITALFQNSSPSITIAEDVLFPLPEAELKLERPELFPRQRQDPPPREEGLEEWGVQRVRSSEAHYLLKSMDLNPSPVAVGVIDTGVRGSHEALSSSYYGTYGWLDPYELTLIPNDGNGHGTHVTGTILGMKGIGVANSTSTKWMACKGCSTTTCSTTALLICGQYITCPTHANMSAPDCGRAPAIVSNSWGSTAGGLTWFDDVIATWHAAGIIPVFSSGNSGPNCGTAGSPGDRNVISVGSTTIDDIISGFSSRGPTQNGNGVMKPDFSAPGQAVLSSVSTSDTSYAIYSGTSMACPHVSGVIAILKSANPSLTFQQVKELLTDGVDTASLQQTGAMCGGIPDNIFPNFVYGQGRVNAFKSLSKMLVQTTTTPTAPTTMSTMAPTNSPAPTTTAGTTGPGPTDASVVIKTCPSFLLMLFILSQIFKQLSN